MWSEWKRSWQCLGDFMRASRCLTGTPSTQGWVRTRHTRLQIYKRREQTTAGFENAWSSTTEKRANWPEMTSNWPENGLKLTGNNLEDIHPIMIGNPVDTDSFWRSWKLLEVWFSSSGDLGEDDLRSIPGLSLKPCWLWRSVKSFPHKGRTLWLTSISLESSMFVSQRRMILKTCGTLFTH